MTTINNTYDGLQVQQEINMYQSKYWLNYNYQYVCNAYNEFRKAYEDTEVTLPTFELLLYFHMFNLWKADNGREQITNEYLNLYTKNYECIILPTHIQILKESYERSQEIRQIFVDQVLKLTIPTPIPREPFDYSKLTNEEVYEFIAPYNMEELKAKYPNAF